MLALAAAEKHSARRLQSSYIALPVPPATAESIPSPRWLVPIYLHLLRIGRSPPPDIHYIHLIAHRNRRLRSVAVVQRQWSRRFFRREVSWTRHYSVVHTHIVFPRQVNCREFLIRPYCKFTRQLLRVRWPVIMFRFKLKSPWPSYSRRFIVLYYIILYYCLHAIVSFHLFDLK